MSFWSTKALNKDTKYVVIRHSLRGINSTICGVRFRSSYGVVEKDSKKYNELKRMPVFKGTNEYDITFLKELPFITRSLDIKQVYGQEVYAKFVKAVREKKEQEKLEKQKKEEQLQEERKQELEKKKEYEEKLKQVEESEPEKAEEIKAEMPEIEKCAFVTHTGTLCKFEAWECSPSGYCKMHVIHDPKLEELGIKKPNAMTSSERKKFRKSLYKKLEKLKKSGAF